MRARKDASPFIQHGGSEGERAVRDRERIALREQEEVGIKISASQGRAKILCGDRIKLREVSEHLRRLVAGDEQHRFLQRGPEAAQPFQIPRAGCDEEMFVAVVAAAQVQPDDGFAAAAQLLQHRLDVPQRLGRRAEQRAKVIALRRVVAGVVLEEAPEIDVLNRVRRVWHQRVR